MKIIKVQYTVKEEYAEENKKRIAKVMEEMRAQTERGVKYHSFVLKDGKTFVHLVMYRDEHQTELPGTLDSFKAFQEGLKGNTEIPPKAEEFNYLDASYSVFEE